MNWKWGIILGGAGLVLSLIVGLISGTGFPNVLLRAFVFAGIFFGLGAVLWYLISNFIPELLNSDTGKDGQEEGEPGSRINISLEDNKLLPEMFNKPHSGEEIGDIGDLSNNPGSAPGYSADGNGSAAVQGVDQIPEDGYNGGSQSGQMPGAGGKPSGSEEMPNFDLMAGSFSDSNNDGSADGNSDGGLFEPERKPSGNKSQPLKGDFAPKELAEGIRTILSEDK